MPELKHKEIVPIRNSFGYLLGMHGRRAGVEPVRRYGSGKTRILVFDGLVSQKTIREILGAVPKLKSPVSVYHNDIVTTLDLHAFVGSPACALLDRQVRRVLRRHFPKLRGHSLTDVASNHVTREREPSLHRDGRVCERCLTCVYYGNEKWESVWGGETIFYDDDWDAVFCVTPRPGRVVIFNDVLHRASLPTGCPVPRVTLGLAYRCSAAAGARAELLKGLLSLRSERR